MARSKAKQADPDAIVHLQVKPGKTVLYKGIVYGDRSTLQVPRRDLDRVEGAYVEVNPASVPDVADAD